ncbi:DoxX family protein [Mycolicibacterium fortuitum subsp. fortuitum DSM 46621 = ATCC 6841 = JCM 6387]|nr:DoxX family protein [Mycolicibacterium fortuitum subsp. fortuitum DSM 46621 = ATCC 6841 = JCM 6387]
MTNTIETGAATADMTDTGLLLLRIATGATMLQAGLIKAFDFGTAVGFMESSGWRLPAFGAFMVTAAETLGGIGLLLGILTPLAACAVIGRDGRRPGAVNVSADAFWSQPFNVPFLAAFGAAALLFTDAGAYSVDQRVFGRSRVSGRASVGLAFIGVAVAVVTWIALNGTNPIHFTKPGA